MNEYKDTTSTGSIAKLGLTVGGGDAGSIDWTFQEQHIRHQHDNKFDSLKGPM